MALKTSLVIAGDASEATSALREVDQALAKNNEQAKSLASAYDAADRSIQKVAAAQTTAKQATAQAKAEYAAGQISIREYNARLLETKTALGLVESEHRQAVNAIKQAQSAIGATGGVTRQAQAGYVNLGRQVQDVAVQLQSGTNIGTIIAQQGGQVADAVAQMGGRFAGFASFMAGPWGAGGSAGVGVLINLVQEMWRSSEAADAQASAFQKVESASSGLSDAQSLLGDIFNKTTGEISAQNEVLLINARIMAANLRLQAQTNNAKAQALFGKFEAGGNPASTGQTILSSVGLASGKTYTNAANARAIVAGIRSGTLNGPDAIKMAAKLDFTGLGIDKGEFLGAIRDAAIAPYQTEVADRIERSLDRGVLDPALRKKGGNKPKSDRKTRTGGDKAEFGEDAADKIARLRDQFSDVPAYVQKVNEAMRQLDDIASDVEKKKPPNYKELVGDIASAKDLIQESLNKPLNDYLEKARASAEIDKLLIAGKDDEARALQVILQLKDQQKPLDDAQLEAVLATVQAERERSTVLRDQRALIDANVRGIQSLRGALEQTVADAFRGKFSIGNIIKSIGQSYINIMSQRVVEGLFGNALRELEDQAAGVGKVKQAGEKMATAMGQGSGAVTDFAKTVRDAIGTIEQATSGRDGTASAGAAAGSIAGTANIVSQAVKAAFSAYQRKVGTGVPEGTGDEIVVTAEKKSKADLTGVGELFVDAIDKLNNVVGLKMPKVFTDLLKRVLGNFEQSLPQILAGAFAGQAASSLILGSKGNNIGAAIGGVAGKALGEAVGGPIGGAIGSVLGGLLGGVVGGMFKKTKWGSAAITNGQISGGGNKDDFKTGANSAAGSVATALDQIAERLGASVGNYAVSIGLTNGKWNVNPGTVTGKIGTTYQKDTIDFKQDQAGAIAWAIGNAIGDGAIKGVSAAVQKALKSSTDIDKALREALKVQDVELLIGGIGAELQKAFRDFDNQAAERLRIATQYGFDVVKLEERNAADRLKLSQRLFDQQAGSLQQLIDEMTSGTLFEGSAVDRRGKLIEQINAVKADAKAGVEGAADKLAGLLEQLNQVSKDAYGTTGGFAADRTLILDQAREAIAEANLRIANAGKGSDPALATTNSTLDEIAEQNAIALSEARLSNDLLKQIAAANAGLGNPVYSRLAALARTS